LGNVEAQLDRKMQQNFRIIVILSLIAPAFDRSCASG